MTPNDLSLLPLLPTLVLVGGGIALILSEAFQTSGDRGHQAPIAAVASGLALVLAFAQLAAPAPSAPIFAGALRADAFQAFVAVVVSAGLLLTVLVSASFTRRLAIERGEYYGLMLFAAAGMVLLAMSNDLLMVFIALETMSISTYALAAYVRRGHRSTEAAFKYFVLGAFSSALFLYGAALAYGATGTTRLSGLADAAQAVRPTLVGPALALIIAGFAFKVAAVPFHMWAPDVYEGAPTPVTAFMAVGVKAAAFAAFFRTLAVAFASEPGRWQPALGALAILTMVVGNLLALPQRNVKRMLAYSSIGHAGYLLIGIASADAGGRVGAGAGLLFYLAAYTVSAVGAFGIAAALERRELDAPNAWDLDRLAGLARRRPLLALFMAAFMASLAGIPTTAGFMGKLLLFGAALEAGQIGLAVVGVVTSAVAAYYYLRVIVYMYFRGPEPVTEADERMPALEWGVALACVLVFVLGLGPNSLAAAARRSAELLFS